MIAELLEKRWSPRSFTGEPVDDEKIRLLFEAARWAPSSMNEQPWSYYYAHREDNEKFDRYLECLMPGNSVWAKNASILIIGVAGKLFRSNGKPNRHYLHDTGAASTMIAVQAAAMGMQAHQMGGFYMERTIEMLNLDPELYEPSSFIAVGYQDKPDNLPENLKEKERAPRSRRDIDEFVNP
jgi:nitroreductase